MKLRLLKRELKSGYTGLCPATMNEANSEIGGYVLVLQFWEDPYSGGRGWVDVPIEEEKAR